MLGISPAIPIAEPIRPEAIVVGPTERGAGERIPLVSQQGIFKPQRMELPLTLAKLEVLKDFEDQLDIETARRVAERCRRFRTLCG
jgi:hypothetical protein